MASRIQYRHASRESDSSRVWEYFSSQHAQTGRYDVYINVYEMLPMKFEGNAYIEVYLGDGTRGTASLVDTVPLDATEGRWFHVGYYVAHTSQEQFEALSSRKGRQPKATKVQDKPAFGSPYPRVSLSWVQVGELMPKNGTVHPPQVFLGPEDMDGGETYDYDY